MNLQEWTNKLNSTIDSMDADKFAEFLTDDAKFIFGNIPAVEGKQNVRNFVDNFYKSIKALEHQGLGVISQGNNIVAWGIVTYTRHNGTKLSVKFCNVFTMKENLIQNYDIYVDTSLLYAE